MKLFLAAAGILLLVGATAHADVYFDDEDGYQTSQTDDPAPVNPCDPDTFDADNCITPR